MYREEHKVCATDVSCIRLSNLGVLLGYFVSVNNRSKMSTSVTPVLSTARVSSQRVPMCRPFNVSTRYPKTFVFQ